MIVDTKKLKTLLNINRISVRNFGAEIFSNDTYTNQAAKATRLINNRLPLTQPLIKSICELLNVKANEFVITKNDKFTIEIENKEYLFSELPKDYQNSITHYHFRYYVVNEDWNIKITDEQKIAWFKLINFAGTPQDAIHLKSLEK